MGDVRLMLPCGESQLMASQEEGASQSAGGPMAVERSNSAFASGDLDLGQQVPNMLVIVLAAFQATSRTTEARVSNFAPPGRICCPRHQTSSVNAALHRLAVVWHALVCHSADAIIPQMPACGVCFWHVEARLPILTFHVGVLTPAPSEKAPKATAAASTAATAAASSTTAAAPASMDKIKAEHMRSSSAMPALDPVKLGTKSSLLPSAAAEATQHAAAAATAAARPAGSSPAAPKLTGLGLATGPSIDAHGKTGRQEPHAASHMTGSHRKCALLCAQKLCYLHALECNAPAVKAGTLRVLPHHAVIISIALMQNRSWTNAMRLITWCCVCRCAWQGAYSGSNGPDQAAGGCWHWAADCQQWRGSHSCRPERQHCMEEATARGSLL